MRSLISHLAAGTTTTTAVGYVISPDYGWVLLVTAILAFELLLIGFIFTGKFRRQYFTQEFMESNFGAEHKAALGVDI